MDISSYKFNINVDGSYLKLDFVYVVLIVFYFFYLRIKILSKEENDV